MIKIGFSKYHGTANDFIIIDEESTPLFNKNDNELIRRMCDRRTGIGADGLMLIMHNDRDDIDFEMAYFNSDGNPSSMCGNGGRCITLAAVNRSLVFERARFLFDNDIYFSTYDPSNNWVSLKMQNVSRIETKEMDFILDTGSPHYVKFTDISNKDVKLAGSEIRYSERFKSEGINVNFVDFKQNELHVLTYERGVEDETYSCGTGVVASALSYAEKMNFTNGVYTIAIRTKGGQLEVSFEKIENGYENIFLKGPAIKVFDGIYQE